MQEGFGDAPEEPDSPADCVTINTQTGQLEVSILHNDWRQDDWHDGLEALVDFIAQLTDKALSLILADKSLSIDNWRKNALHSEWSLQLSDNQAIQILNQDWRHQNKPTNVLSFPAQSEEEIEMILLSLDAEKPDKAPPVLLGDVVLARETLIAEAQAAGKPVRHHFAHLIVHGFLHLWGYDHQQPDQADRMEALEIKVLNFFDVPSPYEEA
ncbi:MAG: rRNA maturation RNase YbeY [Parvibaculales bacterium]